MAIHRLSTDVAIKASAERVWTALTDFAAYPEWNPFIRSVVGAPVPGERLRVTLQSTAGKVMHFSPLVLVAVPGHELRWLGRFLVPGLFDGEHSFIIEPLGPGEVRLRHCEVFSGVLVGFSRASLDRDTKAGFEAMNQALKRHLESSSVPQEPPQRRVE